jgi:hypothetical protein
MVMNESRNLLTLLLFQAVLQLQYPLHLFAGDGRVLIVVGASVRLMMTPAGSAAWLRRRCAEGVIGKAWSVGEMTGPVRGRCEQRRSQSSVSTGNSYASWRRQSQDR